MCTIRINFTLAQEQISSVPVPFVHTAEVAGEKTVSRTSRLWLLPPRSPSPEEVDTNFGKVNFRCIALTELSPKKENWEKSREILQDLVGLWTEAASKTFSLKKGGKPYHVRTLVDILPLKYRYMLVNPTPRYVATAKKGFPSPQWKTPWSLSHKLASFPQIRHEK